MREHEQASTAVAVREEARAIELLSDDEMRRTYRIAESLYMSGAWKLKNAEQAFAKMVVGRDLGLTPAQAMQGIHIVEGGIQMHYAQLGQFVRAREGYDYRAGWLKEDGAETLDVSTGQTERAAIVAVFHEDEEVTDLRPIVGAFVEFFVNGERRGVSRFTTEDAQAAGLIKPDKPAQAWKTARRNMLLARAMSNGAKWFVPEVFGGMPVYTDGEIPERKSITAPVADGSDDGSGIDLGPKVEAMIARAEALGHRGLSNRGAVEIAVGRRAPGVVNEWLGRAKAELDRFEAEKAKAEASTGDPQADAVDAAERPVEEPEQEVTAEPTEEPTEEAAADAEPADAVLAVMRGPEPAAPGEPPVLGPKADVVEDPEVLLLRDRLRRLEEIDPTEIAEEQAESLNAEIEMLEGKLRERGVEPYGPGASS